MRQKYGVESQILYPPVENDFPQVPFADRENGFVCLGRVVPEKRVDAIIEILSRVRERGHHVHLHILGGFDDSSYSATVKKLADRNKDWVYLEGWTMGRRKKELLAGHRYGIHGRENEPFGIAVAEMARAGCIVFVPKGGGQVEIVDHPSLVFESEADAVEKIAGVLTNDAERERLRAHLKRTSKAYSVENFKEAMRNVVAEFLAQRVAH
jgi:glycosyltransferase involved in cell wall biosynthesis